jgi:pilus assembly protein CpaB
MKTQWLDNLKQSAWQGGNKKIGFLLGISLTTGGLAAAAALGYVKQEVAAEKARLTPNERTEQIVVANADLPKGAVVNNQTMALRQVPIQYVTSQSIRPDRFDVLLGARLGQPLKAGDPLTSAHIDEPEVTSFSSKVKTGIRAITVSVDEVSSVSGMVQPGDHIDLLWSVKPSSLKLGDANTPEKTVVFMQDVTVLATGKQVKPSGEETRARSYTTVTVEATSQQAQQLVVAQRTGKLTALLRNPGDHQPMLSREIDLSSLLDIKPGVPIQKHGTELFVGGKGELTKQIVGELK